MIDIAALRVGGETLIGVYLPDAPVEYLREDIEDALWVKGANR